jgi:hypothetical protein
MALRTSDLLKRSAPSLNIVRPRLERRERGIEHNPGLLLENPEVAARRDAAGIVKRADLECNSLAVVRPMPQSRSAFAAEEAKLGFPAVKSALDRSEFSRNGQSRDVDAG